VEYFVRIQPLLSKTISDIGNHDCVTVFQGQTGCSLNVKFLSTLITCIAIELRIENTFLVKILILFQCIQCASVSRCPLELAVFILVVTISDIACFGECGCGIQLYHIIGPNTHTYQIIAYIARIFFQECFGNFFEFVRSIGIFQFQTASFHPIFAQIDQGVIAKTFTRTIQRENRAIQKVSTAELFLGHSGSRDVFLRLSNIRPPLFPVIGQTVNGLLISIVF